MKPKIGFLGTGYMGQIAHLDNYTALPECEVVAIAECRPELANAVAGKYGIPKVYSDHKQLLEDNNVDAIVCTQPFHNNYWLGKEVLQSGKSLITEKPMVLRLDDGQELVDIANQNKSLYAVGFMKRYDPGVQLARRRIEAVIESGSMGMLKMVDACCFMGDWRQNPGSPIGTNEKNPPALEARYPDHIQGRFEREYDHCLNIYSHNINLIRFLLPDQDLSCLNATHIDDAYTMSFISSNTLVNLKGTYTASHTWQEETHCIFERGRISVYTPSPLNRQDIARVTVYESGEEAHSETELHAEVEWAFYCQARGFVSALRGEAQLLAPGEDSLNDVAVMEDVFRKLEA